MKIAIIGSGISGISAAYNLDKDHEIVIYESNPRIGGHTNTVSVEDELGNPWNIDMYTGGSSGGSAAATGPHLEVFFGASRLRDDLHRGVQGCGGGE